VFFNFEVISKEDGLPVLFLTISEVVHTEVLLELSKRVDLFSLLLLQKKNRDGHYKECYYGCFVHW
jgi:hypothetical protein